MTDVGGVADLARLAVADDVDASVDLPLHGVVHAALYSFVERGRIDHFIAILREQQVEDLVRSRQAPDVRGEDPVEARHVNLV